MLLPPASSTLLQVLYNVSNFNLMQNPHVQYWLSTYVFKHAKAFRTFLFDQDPMVIMVGGSSLLLITVFAMAKVFKNQQKVQNMKEKLMFSSILRS